MTREKNCRLVATDLDGTLLRDDKTISARTREALRRVQEVGIALVLVTGRPPRRLKIVAQELGLTGLAVCCNGAIVYDLAADAIVQHDTLSSETARQLVTALREAVPERLLRQSSAASNSATNRPIPR